MTDTYIWIVWHWVSLVCCWFKRVRWSGNLECVCGSCKNIGSVRHVSGRRDETDHVCTVCWVPVRHLLAVWSALLDASATRDRSKCLLYTSTSHAPPACRSRLGWNRCLLVAPLPNASRIHRLWFHILLPRDKLVQTNAAEFVVESSKHRCNEGDLVHVRSTSCVLIV